MDYSNFRPGDWLCTCGGHNYASKSVCFKCYTSKEVATGGAMSAFPRTAAVPAQQQAAYPGMQQMGQQMAQMGGQMTSALQPALSQQGLGQMGMPAAAGQQSMTQMNNALLAQMGGLQGLMGAYGMMGMGMPQLPQTPANFRTGDWMCKCGNHNYSSKMSCGKCQISKDAGDLSNINVLATLGMGGLGAYGAQPGVPMNAPAGFRAGDWICKCGNHNYAKRDTCGRCQGSKDENDNTDNPARQQNFQVGDWMCQCGAHNYRSKAACHKCNLPKAQGNVTTTTPATNPNYRQGDWMCSCGNHNYASRGQCKICNLSKEAAAAATAAGEQRGRSRSPERNETARDRSRSPATSAQAF